MSRPGLFVGSSTEGLRIAQAVQVVLDESCEVELWTQGVFGLGRGTLESLVLALPRFDFALLVLTADDLMISRGAEKLAARDNVLFELGLFTGSLGRDRTFMLFDRTNPPVLPTDFSGITAATFAPHSSGNLEAALGAPCAKIHAAVEKLGIRSDKSLRQLAQATNSVENVGETMQSLVRLLTRSRKVEIEIFLSQFGPMLKSEYVQELRKDLADIIAMLAEADAVEERGASD
jgi:hypothetical protein